MSVAGKGTVTYAAPDGGIAEKFEGDWSDGKMHGFGKYLYADGGVFEGEWVDGKVCAVASLPSLKGRNLTFSVICV